jgi:uncharacterized protein YaeQ
MLYRFRIELTDVTRGVYDTLDFRVAMHPSEAIEYLLTRVLAFALNVGDDLAFTPEGLSDPDAPCLRAPDAQGGTRLSIEIGNPTARRLHKAAKAARAVKVYTYKDPELLLREMQSQPIHNVERIGLHSFAPEFLRRLAARLERDNRWTLVHTDGSLMVGIGEDSELGEVMTHAFYPNG